MTRNPSVLMLGNGAIARGLLESGCEVATAYPGTPSTEILEETIEQASAAGIDITTEWSVNEKVAFDIALAAAITGKRALVAMKQVGLNVASDSLLSAAYTGIVGGFVVVACDDPGPHSSQTEQDSRLFSLFAKVPVFDPSSPREARAMTSAAFVLSERHRIPVLLRPTTAVCHARQPIELRAAEPLNRPARFDKDPQRWAATPRFRLKLHRELNEKLENLRQEFETSPFNREDPGEGPLGIIAGGIAWAVTRDLLAEEGWKIPLLKIGTPHPLPLGLVTDFVRRHERVLVIEEPDYAIEVQIPDRRKVRGRMTGDVPSSGELTPEVLTRVIRRFLKGETHPVSRDAEAELPDGAQLSPPPSACSACHDVEAEAPLPELPPGPPPTLCPGCGHRATFFDLRRALPKAIYAGDIGCYTLGVNQGAMDTCLDMGASITLANGFWHAHRRDGIDIPIVAIIGDSTFFHSGIPGLLNAVASGARFVVLVLDNGTIAMTGFQPTPATSGANIEKVARALGVPFVETIDPFETKDSIALIRRAHEFTRKPDGGLALVVFRRPCALMVPPTPKGRVEVTQEKCTSCDVCLRQCGCPALVKDPDTGKVRIDRFRCNDCGNCIDACPPHAIGVGAAVGRSS